MLESRVSLFSLMLYCIRIKSSVLWSGHQHTYDVPFDPHHPSFVHVTPGRSFAACVHEIQFELRRDQSVSVKNKPSFYSRFCFNPHDKMSEQNLCISHFLTSAGKLSPRVSDLCISQISWNMVCPRSPPSLPPVHRPLGCGKVSARLLRARLIWRSGPPAKVPNYL